MARLKEKPVPIFFRRNRFVVDYRDQFGRHRDSFESEPQALEHWNKVKDSTKPLVLKNNAIIERSIKKSIRQYCDLFNEKRIGKTADNEKYYFEELFLFLSNECKLSFVHEIDTFHIELFQSRNRKRGLKGSTINRKLNSYKAWLNKCLNWGLIAKNPMDDVCYDEVSEPDVKTWSKDEFENTISKVPDWLKDVLFFIDETGRRPIDAARATFGDIDESNQTIRIKSFKGGKSRIFFVPLTKDLFEMIMQKKSIAKREFRGRDSDLIFLNAKKRPVTTNAIGLALRKKIRGRTAYGLRHTFINDLVDDGVQARDVQLLAGHAKFETTTRYTHRDVRHLKAASEARSRRRRGVV